VAVCGCRPAADPASTGSLAEMLRPAIP
jgi:hypothetical protein